jgi:diaminopimelate epimerase
VEQCGNGARCFARYVRDRGLTAKNVIRVQTMKGVIEPRLHADGRVTVDMGAPVFALDDIPFAPGNLQSAPQGSWVNWPLALIDIAQAAPVLIATLSMGNPHAVLQVADVQTAPVAQLAPQIQQSPYFPQGVNVGFLQVVDRRHVALRVYERGVGETLACGTGACAAVVAGIRLGLLDSVVDVQMPGGCLSIGWVGEGASVMMTGPATTVFHAHIEIPDNL